MYIYSCLIAVYSTGTSYYENNQIEEAIEVLNQIPSRSGYYDDAQDLLAKAAVEYCDDVITQSDEYLKNKDYVSSIECLRHALGLLPNDEKLKSAFSSANDQYTSYSLELANGKAKDSKLAEAIGILETALEWVDNDEINSQLNTYRNTYRENIIKKARKKLNTDGYSSAMKILTKALNVLGSDDKLQETIDLFKTYQPVELSDMEPYEITDHVRVGGYEDIEKDNYGKQYPSESIISSYSSLICEEEGKGSVKYYLGKEYSVLEGTIYVPYDARNITKNSDKINEKYGMTKIKIYGDDKLIYEDMLQLIICMDRAFIKIGRYIQPHN